MSLLQKKWWVKTIRERTYFGFRYWWFNYLLLVTTLFFVFGIPFFNRVEEDNCLNNNNTKKEILAIENALSSCCDCKIPHKIIDDTTSKLPTKDSVAVDCPDRILAFQVCNSNSAIDDNFIVFLNGEKIGELDLNENAKIGSVFLATTNTSIKIEQADFICPLENMKLYYFDPKIIKYGRNTILMKNAQSNNKNNEGSIEIRNYLNVGNKLKNPCIIKDLPYNGISGMDFTINFNYTRCCE